MNTESNQNGYSIIKTCKNGELVEERWLKAGILNRKDGPSIIKYQNFDNK